MAFTFQKLDFQSEREFLDSVPKRFGVFRGSTVKAIGITLNKLEDAARGMNAAVNPTQAFFHRLEASNQLADLQKLVGDWRPNDAQTLRKKTDIEFLVSSPPALIFQKYVGAELSRRQKLSKFSLSPSIVLPVAERQPTPLVQKNISNSMGLYRNRDTDSEAPSHGPQVGEFGSSISNGSSNDAAPSLQFQRDAVGGSRSTSPTRRSEWYDFENRSNTSQRSPSPNSVSGDHGYAPPKEPPKSHSTQFSPPVTPNRVIDSKQRGTRRL